MNLLKKIPVHYMGELHDVRLINFSVDIDEIEDKIPEQIKVRRIDGRAMISMVDVKLKKMRPVFAPSFLNFEYRHVAFRVLVEDGKYNNGEDKGIFFYRSFTTKPWIVVGGKCLTDYNLELAAIQEHNGGVEISQGKHQVKYQMNEVTANKHERMKSVIGALDRAYSISGDTIRVTQIQREKWPIQAVECSDFQTTFFNTAKFECAFRVCETIFYEWLPPKTLLK
jgi:uncharacterized protein YqjF (DUF2071 family)